ncbi:MAG: hypothetical protein EBZ59_04060 [Planctomycetia bacterium]|nr:hypothetical protein [Planctomycetia bacterium]
MNRLLRFAVAAAVFVASPVCRMASAPACPFCSAVSLTFSQEIAQSQAAVIARLVEPPPAGSLSPRAEGPLPKGRFAVVKTLKGADLVAEAGLLGEDARPIEAITLEEKPAGTLFLLMGIEPPKLVWSSPIPVSERAVAYLEKLSSLPEKGPDRLAFFQHYLEDADETLARDAYDEFAVAPYEDVRGLENRMDPTQLLAWIENPRVQASRRRLYATMLGVCGTRADAERIESILVGGDAGDPAAGGRPGGDRAEVRSGLDALIACYVTLRGAEGLELVDRLFLRRKGRDVPFTETYAAVMALRFLGEESDAVPRPRVLESLRILLEEPKLADLVVADLARWEDWSAVATLTELFEKADADNIFVREPIVNYLRACPLPEAAEALRKLEAIDPEAVRRAAALAGFAGAIPPRPAATGSGTAGATAPGDDGDPGEPAPGSSVESSGGATSVGDAALAARIAPVLGDEEANDDLDGVDPSAATPAAVPAPPGGSSSYARWGVWLAAVLLVGLLARAALQSGADGGHGGRGR